MAALAAGAASDSVWLANQLVRRVSGLDSDVATQLSEYAAQMVEAAENGIAEDTATAELREYMVSFLGDENAALADSLSEEMVKRRNKRARLSQSRVAKRGEARGVRSAASGTNGSSLASSGKGPRREESKFVPVSLHRGAFGRGVEAREPHEDRKSLICLLCGKIWFTSSSQLRKGTRDNDKRVCPVCNVHVDAVDPITGKVDPLYNIEMSQKKKKKRLNERSRNAPPDLKKAHQEAVARKDRLVNFDKTQKARSRVFDDQNDYFEQSQDSWLSKTERAKAKEQDGARRAGNRRSAQPFRIEVDIAGRRVMREEGAAASGAAHLDGRARSVYEKVTAAL